MEMTEIIEKKEAKARPLEEIEKVEKEKMNKQQTRSYSSSDDVVGGSSSSSSSYDREYEVLTIHDRLKASRGSRFNLIAKELGLNDGWKKKFSRRALLHGWVIDPNNRLYRIWIKFILLSWAVYSSFFTPMEFGFFRGLPENLFILDIIGQLVFLVDIVLQFFVAYRDKQTYRTVYKRTHIALRYLKSTFIIDLLACMPWDLIYKACGRKEEVRFLLWIRLYRVKRVMNFFQNLEKDIRVNYIIARIVKLIAVELYCTHTAACIFYYLATTLPESQEGYTWIGSLKLGDYSYSKFREIDLWKRYTTSLYFAIVTMATVGYGDIHAVNLREMIFVMAYVSFDMVLGAYLIGNMTALIVKGSKTEKFRDKMTDLLKYMNRNRLGRDIREQTKGHVRLQFESSYTDASVLQDIPISIRSKISQTLYLPYIQEVSLFRGCSSEFVNQIVTRLHEEFFLPGEIIMEQGNVVDQLYFVCDGMLEAIGTAEDGSEETISLLQPNSSFGEISILCNIAQPYTVRVCELCRVLRLDKQSFSNIIDIYFYDGKKVLDNLLEGKESLQDKQLESDITFHIGKLEAELALKVNKASFDGNLDHLKSLFRAGADPNKTDYDGRSPLHLAASRGHKEIILFLIQEGADINIKDNFGNTPLLEAVMNGHDRIASLLVREGASMKIENGGSFLCTAVAKGDLKYVKMLLSNGMDPNDTDYDGRSPLHLAARKGYEDILLVLIEKGADINIKDNFGNTPLFEAVKNRHDKVASLLVREGASMEIENGGSFLCTAVSKGDSDYVKRLLSNGMDPNKTDYDGRSPLHVAARKGYEDIIVLLIQEGVDINVKDNFGNTPLLEAVNNGHDRIASLLVKEGGSMKIENGGSFLCTIVAKGDSEYLTRLLSNGMDPNLKDYDHRTPLHVAAAEGLIFIAKLLLEAGASIFTKDRWGNTPLDDARMSGNKNLIKLLEDAKSDQLSEFSSSPEFTDKMHQKKCTVYPFHPRDPKEHEGNGIVLWVPQTIEELIKTAISSDSCILSEDAGKITDVNMIKDDQRLYLVRQTVH